MVFGVQAFKVILELSVFLLMITFLYIANGQSLFRTEV